MVTCEIPPEVSLEPPPRADRRVKAEHLPAVAIASAFVPVMVLFGLALWSRPHYQFFPLLVPGAAVLVWRSCRRLGVLEPGDPQLSWGAAGLSWCLLAAGVAFLTPWFAALGALAGLLGAAYALGGTKLARAALPAWLFLWLAVPLPKSFDFALIAKLQDLVSAWSSVLLDVVKVYHVMKGNVVEVAGRELLVDQACSGVYSLFTLLAGTIFYAILVRATPLRAAVVAAAAVFWVLFGNVLRIVIVVMLGTRWGVDIATGWKHTALGLLMFPVMLGLVMSTERLLAFVMSAAAWARSRFSEPVRRQLRKEKIEKLKTQSKSTNKSLLGVGPLRTTPGRPAADAPRGQRPEPEPSSPGAAGADATDAPDSTEAGSALSAADEAPALPDRTVVPPLGRTWLGSWVAGTAFGVLLLPQAVMPGVHWGEILLPSHAIESRFSAAGADVMPVNLGPYRRVDFRTERREWDNSWGEHSRIWSYRSPERGAGVSLDYDFTGWHDLTVCYTSRGWRLDSQHLEPMPPRGGATRGQGQGQSQGHVMAADFTSVEGRHAFLVFSLFDKKGRPYDPPGTYGPVETLRLRLASWARTSETGGQDGGADSYQLQMFFECETPMTPAEKAEAVTLFGQARDRVDAVGTVRPVGGK